MQFAPPSKRGFLAPGIPRINWDLPITTGLLGCYVPSAFAGTRKIYNLAARAGGSSALALLSAASYANTREGTALQSTVTNGMASVTCPVSMRPTQTCSLYYRGQNIASISTNAPVFFGVTFTNANTGPYYAFAIGSGVTGFNDIGLYFNRAGTFDSTSTSATLTAGQTISAGGTFVTGSAATMRFYYNGALFENRQPLSGDITYGATPLLVLGGLGAMDTTSHVNGTSSLGCMWNRALSASEMASMHVDPYQFLVWPEDDILATIVGVTAAGSKSITFSVAETSAISDAVIRTRKVIDLVAETSAITPVVARARRVAGTIAETSALTFLAGKLKAVTFPVAETSALTIAANRSRQVIDAMSETSALSFTAVKLKTLVLSVAETSALSVVARRARAISETIAATSVITIAANKFGFKFVSMSVAETSSLTIAASTSGPSHKPIVVIWG